MELQELQEPRIAWVPEVSEYGWLLSMVSNAVANEVHVMFLGCHGYVEQFEDQYFGGFVLVGVFSVGGLWPRVSRCFVCEIPDGRTGPDGWWWLSRPRPFVCRHGVVLPQSAEP